MLLFPLSRAGWRCLEATWPTTALGASPSGLQALMSTISTAQDSGVSSLAAATSVLPGSGLVAVAFRGVTIQVKPGTRLRAALLEAGLTPHNSVAQVTNCRGLGACGTCAVQISGEVEPPQWSKREGTRLSLPPHGPPGNARLRLACQVRVKSDIRVTKFDQLFGQGVQLLRDLTPDEAALVKGVVKPKH